MTKLFGTDGVRGVANRELTPELAFRLGRAGAYILTQEGGPKRLLVGRDTRISGAMLEASLVAGICSSGADVLSVEVLPTPAIAYLTTQADVVGGIVISASHNPVEDNGIKFFGPGGYKLPDEKEQQIEDLLNVIDELPRPEGGQVGRIIAFADAAERYLAFLRQGTQVNCAGLKIVVDCANGAAYQVAPKLLAELGAEVIPIFNQPDGININDGCGSTHPEKLMAEVLKQKADLGLAFDGDADRLLAVDHTGELIDGDQIMVICSRYLKNQNRLPNNTVVVTVMSNLGLHLAMSEVGINVLTTQVGDRYVLEELLLNGAAFGGEQSGHILFLEHNTTGDGLLTALQLLEAVQASEKNLAGLASQMERLPQMLVNVPVLDKDQVMDSPILKQSIRAAEAKLKGQGRILVRPSGTESLVRVMAELRDMEQLRKLVDELVKEVEKINGFQDTASADVM